MDGFCPKPIDLSILKALINDHCLQTEPTAKCHPGAASGGGGGGDGHPKSGRTSSGGSTMFPLTRDVATSRRKEESSEEASLLGDDWTGVEEGDGPGSLEKEATREVIVAGICGGVCKQATEEGGGEGEGQGGAWLRGEYSEKESA